MTRAIILAAGFGSRLMPLTCDRPKGMVSLLGLPILIRQIAVLRDFGINDITIVGGYKSEWLRALGLPVILNHEYDNTNMVESLLAARALFDGRHDVIVAYGDIIYEPRVLSALKATSGEVVVAADTGWKELWSFRMDDYWDDIESFRVGSTGKLIEIGKRPKTAAEIEAQYIGLIRFSADCHGRMLETYDGLDRTSAYDGQPFLKMYMTTFIQKLIDDNWDVRPAYIRNGWLEIDTVDDLKRYQMIANTDRLASLCSVASACGPTELLKNLFSACKDNTGPPLAKGQFDIRTLAVRLTEPSEPSNITLSLLDRLARKIEIADLLHQRYSKADLSVSEDSKTASGLEAACLLAAYLVAADRTADLRHLNTVLKALDGSIIISCRNELESLCAERLDERD